MGDPLGSLPVPPSPRTPRNDDAPLLGLRWVPDSQLRPLRYIPTPPRTPAASSSSPQPSAEEVLTPAHLQSKVRLLKQRLGDTEDAVRQKTEQIRWLKEMTKTDARRARVNRWMSGPLVRVFAAWRRAVREAVRGRREDLEEERDGATERARALQKECDEQLRENGVLQAALEVFFRRAHDKRVALGVRRAWRALACRRAVLHKRGRAPERRALTALAAAAAARRRAAALGARAADRGDRRAARATLRRMRMRTRVMTDAAKWHATFSQRAAMKALRVNAAAWRRRKWAARAAGDGGADSERGMLRRAMGAWQGAVVARLRADRQTDAAAAKRATKLLAGAEARAAAAEAEARQLRDAKTLWGESELPTMVAELTATAAAAEAAAAAGTDAGGGAAAAAGDAAAAAAYTWQGSQLKLCLTTLDSLKRELARERAAAGCARDDARRADATAEEALTMLQAVREEGIGLQSRVGELEEARERTAQALRAREIEGLARQRAQHAAARAIAASLDAHEAAAARRMRALEAACDGKGAKLAALQRKVQEMADGNRDSKINAMATGMGVKLSM